MPSGAVRRHAAPNVRPRAPSPMVLPAWASPRLAPEMSWRSGAIFSATRNPNLSWAAANALPAALDHISDGVLLLDHGGLVKHANTQALARLHCRMDELVGRDFWDLLPADMADAHQAETEKALQASGEHGFVVNDKFADTWTEYAVRLYADGYVVNLKDMAETHELEKLLDDSERYNQLVFEANPNAMWLYDTATLKVLSANQ